MQFKSLLLTLLVTLCVSCEATHKPHYTAATAENRADTVFPIPTGFINDFDNILSDEQEAILLNLVKQHEAETSNQISIVTLTSIQEYSGLEEYSLDLANNWGVGQEGKNNGVLIALYMKDRRIWIQNGDGIMEKLTDDETLAIINKTIVPEFKKDDYFTGFQKGVEAIIKELKQP
ncbi:TPM domain-containing protein [Kordia sp. YSTF-M3]|uniref:TPM domain-containing protein n=1 Tax=Kordia aestuariivivens TaxID=2759037 RepID=A0ABR7Q4N3_9FLAO|nr:TPM domain-containing protein [Kordia aestuariivivens]MBC8753507.1 TPM domain-containing protein [Kordia aestuariivivens]